MLGAEGDGATAFGGEEELVPTKQQLCYYYY